MLRGQGTLRLPIMSKARRTFGPRLALIFDSRPLFRLPETELPPPLLSNTMSDDVPAEEAEDINILLSAQLRDAIITSAKGREEDSKRDL
jgi:hypothetical protein